MHLKDVQRSLKSAHPSSVADSQLRGAVEAVAETLIHLDYESWNFGDSVAFEGLLVATDVLDDPRYAAFAHGWARAWAVSALPFRRLDCTAPGLALVHIAEKNDDPLLLARLVELSEYLRARPLLHGIYETWEHSPLMLPYGDKTLTAAEAALVESPPPGVFLDCLHFDPPFFAALAAALQDQALADEAIDQALAYVRLLQVESGLFDHFALVGSVQTYGAAWGRGQGWALLGLLDVIAESRRWPEALQVQHAASLELLADSAVRLIHAMIPLQLPNGHWLAVVTDPASGDEYSTAAFMAAGFARAVELGVIAAEVVAVSLSRAQYATQSGVDGDGGLGSVSVAVMACTENEHYSAVPRGYRVPWGQGPALLALAPLLTRPSV